jgi:hypothetical protein
MARVEKRYDKRGHLAWARGAARDIYKDQEVLDSYGVYFRLAGEESSWFNTLIPRHMASWEVEGPPSAERLEQLYSNIPPFKEWRFALIGYVGPKRGYLCIAQEIDGDRLVEVTVRSPVSG